MNYEEKILNIANTTLWLEKKSDKKKYLEQEISATANPALKKQLQELTISLSE